jgi:hypothetical protein
MTKVAGPLKPAPAHVITCGHSRRAVLEARGKLDRLWCYQGPADVELDLGVRKKWYVAWVAEVVAAVEERGHVTGRGADVLATERFASDIEEIAERGGALDRRFDVDDPVRRVRV